MASLPNGLTEFAQQFVTAVTAPLLVGCVVWSHKCVLFTFVPPIIPLIYLPGYDLNSNVSQNMDASVSLIPAMDVPGIAKLHVL